MDTLGDPKRNGNTATAASTAQSDERGSSARRKRGARHSHKSRPATADGDRAQALEVLASVGATPDDARVKFLGKTFCDAEADKAADALCDEYDPVRSAWLDVQKLKRALDGVKLVTEAGEELRATLLRVFPLRFLKDEPLSEGEEAVAKRWKLEVQGRRVSEREEGWARRFGMKVPDRRVIVPLVDPSKNAKRGRPVDAAIESTILTAAVVEDWGQEICAADGGRQVPIGPNGWNWEVCAAAVFVTGADRRSYGDIRKSFRSWSDRHSHGK